MGRSIAVFLLAACSSGFLVNAAFADVVIALEAFLESGAPVAGFQVQTDALRPTKAW